MFLQLFYAYTIFGTHIHSWDAYTILGLIKVHGTHKLSWDA